MPPNDGGSQMDVLPTIMHFLGGPDAVPEGLDGQVFGFNDYERRKPSLPPSLSPCIPSPYSCGCANVQQSDYRGTIATTKLGKTCQRWDSQSPHKHNRTPDEYPNDGLEENYCRNPDGEDGAWCYTTDPASRWEYCDVPDC